MVPTKPHVRVDETLAGEALRRQAARVHGELAVRQTSPPVVRSVATFLSAAVSGRHQPIATQ